MLRCAFSFPLPDGKPGPCKSGKPAGIMVTVTIEDAGETGASSSTVSASCCEQCAQGMIGPILNGHHQQKRAGR